MKKLLTLKLVIVCLICMSGLIQAQSWQIEEVMKPHDFDEMSPDCQGLYSNGNPVIAYGGDGLYLARHNGTNWTFQTLDNDHKVGKGACLKIDSDDNTHIVYSAWIPETSERMLRYFIQVGETWLIRDLEFTRGHDPIFSMAVDSTGNPWIIYTNETDSTVEMVTSDGMGGWNTDTLFMNTQPVYLLDLEIQNEIPYFTYIGNDGLKLGYDFGSGYNYLVVDSDPVNNQFMDMEVDPTGFVHVCYMSGDTTELRYTTLEPEGWPYLPEVVDTSSNNVGRYCSLTIDPSTTNPVIAYLKQDVSEMQLRLAVKEGGNWQHRNVVTGGSYYQYASINIDDNEMIHISYYDNNDPVGYYYSALPPTGPPDKTLIDTRVKYQHPVSSTVNSAGNQTVICRETVSGEYMRILPYHENWRASKITDVGYYTQAISIDSKYDGSPGLVWGSATPPVLPPTGHLVLTELTPEGWVTELIESNTVSQNAQSFLKFDRYDNPHVVYAKATGGLHYAVRENGAWTFSEITSETAHGFTLDVTFSGKPVVSYMDLNSNLYYAEPSGTGSWNRASLYTNSSPGCLAMIQVDHNDRPDIMYMDSVAGHAVHFVNSDTGWDHIDLIEIPYGYGSQCDYCISSAGKHYVAWFNMTANEFQLATADPGSESWTVSTIDDRMISPVYISINLDPLERINVTYYEAVYDRIFNAVLREDIWYDIGMPDTWLDAGETFQVTRRWHNTTSSWVDADEYFFLDVYGEYWFAPSWSQVAAPMATGTDAESIDYEEIFNFPWPDDVGTANGIRFWGGILQSGTSSLYDYDMVEFGWW